MVTERMVSTLARARRLLTRVTERLSPKQRRQRDAFKALRDRFYDEFWRKSAAEVRADIESLGQGFYRIQRSGHWTIVRESDVMLDDHLSLDLVGNKPLIHRLLHEQGFPVIRHLSFNANSITEAQRFLDDLGGAAVVKPAFGTGAGRGVTMGVRTHKDLAMAVQQAAKYRQELLIEQEIRGHNYRLLYLNGELIDAIRRDRPNVIGDGRHRLGDLIDQENAARAAAKTIVSLHPIHVDVECRKTLHAQGLNLRSVPTQGTQVIVKNVINQNRARDNECVIDQVHGSLAALGREIVGALRLKLVGLDLIASNISQPMERDAMVINELNTSPGLHHHVLIANPRTGGTVGSGQDTETSAIGTGIAASGPADAAARAHVAESTDVTKAAGTASPGRTYEKATVGARVLETLLRSTEQT